MCNCKPPPIRSDVKRFLVRWSFLWLYCAAYGCCDSLERPLKDDRYVTVTAVTSYYANGVIKSIQPFSNGMIAGNVRTFHTNGVVERETLYVDGKPTIEEAYTGEDGSSRIESIRRDDGGSTVRFSLGATQYLSVVSYDGNGRLDGDSLAWHPNGYLACYGEYTHGKRGPTRYSCNDDGRLAEMCYYREEDKVLYVEWHGSGSVSLFGQMKEGKRNGYSMRFDTNGMILAMQIYSNGVQEGESKYWYKGGEQIKEQGYTSNGKREGLWLFWYDNGQLSRRTTFKTGCEQGEALFWYTNGAMESVGIYSNGLRYGTWVYYNVDGSTNSIKRFEMWKQVSDNKLQ